MSSRFCIVRCSHATRILLGAFLLGIPCMANAQQGGEVFAAGAKPQLVLKEGAGEGPAWHGEFGLFFSGPEGITLHQTDGKTRLFLPGAGSNGLLFDRAGQLLICQPGSRQVSRLNVKTGKLTVLTKGYLGRPYNQPNDITVDSQGRIYFSDPKYGPRDNMQLVDKQGRKVEGVYRIDRDGSVTRIISHEVDRPNGVLVTPDDRYFFVADNNNNQVGGARKLWRFRLRPGGDVDLASQTLIYDWQDSRGPDGMVLDAKGRLYVAGGLNKANPPFETTKHKGGVYVFSPEGKRVAFVAIPRDEVTNCTFGGADLRTLYVTAGGTLWSMRTRVPGKLPWGKVARR